MTTTRRFQQIRFITMVTLLPLLASACATILRGTRDQVGISSQPSGAEVIVDNEFYGKTPVTAELKRKDKHIVTIKLEGYQPFEMTLTRKASGFVFGNLVFGPGAVIGLAVDALTGGMYNLKPDQVQAELKSGASNASLADGMLYVILTPVVDPAWEKVGQMVRAPSADEMDAGDEAR
jgi:hypothetical protein